MAEGEFTHPTSTAAKNPHTDGLHSLAVEVLHNLQYQHHWSALSIHTEPLSVSRPLPRPLISGVPPQRIYVHPDDQIAELKQGLSENNQASEREWILPTRLKEKWSLHRFAEVFGAIEAVPPALRSDDLGQVMQGYNKDFGSNDRHGSRTAMNDGSSHAEGKAIRRVLLAIVGDDSTVVYYIVHDGLVKPRQN